MGNIRILRDRLHQVLSSRHLRSAGHLLSGMGIGQVVGFGTLLLVALLYEPADLGLAQSVNSVLAMLAVVCCGKLDQGLIIAADSGVARLMAAGTWLAGGFALAVALVLLALEVCGASLPGVYWLLVPAVLLVGISQMVTAAVLRRRAFAELARNRVLQALLGGAATAGSGVAGWGAAGLVLAHVLQQVGGTLRLWRRCVREVTLPALWNGRLGIGPLMRENRHLVFAASGSALINNLAWSLPVLAIAFFYGAAEAGYFALAMRLVSPVRTLLSSTFNQISLGEGGQLIQKGDHSALRSQVRAFFRASLLVAVALAVAGLLAAQVAAVFLTGKWAGLVPYVGPLVLLVSMQLAVSPLTSLPVLLGKQSAQFWFDLARALLVCALFWVGGRQGMPVLVVVHAYVAVMAFMYVLYGRHFLSLAGRDAQS